MCKQLLDDLTGIKLKEKALDRTRWRSGSGRCFRPVVRQTAEWMNEWNNEWMTILESSVQYNNYLFVYLCVCIITSDQPRGLVVRVSDYWSWGPRFDSRFCHGDFSLKGKIPMATMVWVVQLNLGLRPLLVLHIHISPSTSSGQRNCDSWASQPQKSVTLRPQPGEETTKSIRDMWWHWKKMYLSVYLSVNPR
jgi:hypothetical protein